MIYFDNPGIIPEEGFTTMGINVKLNDSPIGHFGTGLKIAIASILRLGGSIYILAGENCYEFDIIKKTVRDKEFDFVAMKTNEGEMVPLGYTTELGKNWEPWMVMRELESNCRDEGGKSGKGAGPAHSPDRTKIVVVCPVVERAYENIEQYFITGFPIAGNAHIEFYRGASSSYFLRGIKVGSFTGDFPVTVNLLNNHSNRLTEDRTLSSYVAMNDLGAHLPEIADKAFLRELFQDDNIGPNTLFDSIDFDQMFNSPSNEWREVLKEVHQRSPMRLSINLVMSLIKDGVLEGGARWKKLKMTETDKKMIEKAKEYVVNLGYDADDVMPLEIYKTELGEDTVAIYDVVTDGIYISPAAFDLGQKYVCTTLHEEFLHKRYRLHDCSRNLQNHLFDRLATIMERHYYNGPL